MYFKSESGPQCFNLGRTVHKCLQLISRHLWTLVNCILDITKEFHVSLWVTAGKLDLAPKFHISILRILQTPDIARRYLPCIESFSIHHEITPGPTTSGDLLYFPYYHYQSSNSTYPFTHSFITDTAYQISNWERH